MGKIEDMRRLREQQFEDSQAQKRKAPAPAAAAPSPSPAKADPVPVVPVKREAAPAPEKPEKKVTAHNAKTATDDKGECTGCGKQKPVSNGLVAQHMKGLGKVCSGSRKKPA